MNFFFRIFLIAIYIFNIKSQTFLNNSLCFNTRHNNQPNCYFGGYPQISEPVPQNTIVALLADVGSTQNSGRVLQLIKENNADLVLHAGDLDYRDNPELWEMMVNELIGTDFPYYTAMGNHEYPAFEGTNGYQKFWFDRLLEHNSTCIGTVGLSLMCSFNGITFFIASPWQNWPTPFISQSDLAMAIEDSFEQFGSKWRICVWHYVDSYYQLGDKPTEADIILYDTCRRSGAIILTGHEHSYARTHLMSDFENRVVVNQNSTMTISEGESIVIVSAVGGHSIRDCENNAENNPWWGSALCRNTDPTLRPGVLFCDFNPNGDDERLANCWFEQIDGQIRDQFNLISSVDQSSLCQPDQFRSCRENITYSEKAVCGVSIDIGCGITIDCGCSLGETCLNGVCECDQTSCSDLGRTCSDIGCVFPFNENVNTLTNNGNKFIQIAIFNVLFFNLLLLISH